MNKINNHNYQSAFLFYVEIFVDCPHLDAMHRVSTTCAKKYFQVNFRLINLPILPKPNIHTMYQSVHFSSLFYLKPMHKLLRYFAINQL